MSTTFTVRGEPASRSGWKDSPQPGPQRSFLAAEALNEYLDVNEWQVERTKQAIRSMEAAKASRTRTSSG